MEMNGIPFVSSGDISGYYIERSDVSMLSVKFYIRVLFFFCLVAYKEPFSLLLVTRFLTQLLIEGT